MFTKFTAFIAAPTEIINTKQAKEHTQLYAYTLYTIGLQRVYGTVIPCVNLLSLLSPLTLHELTLVTIL